MAKTLTASTTAAINWDYQNPHTLLTDKKPREQASITSSISYSSGVGTDQADLVFRDRRTVTEGTPNDDIDLSGVLKDIFGDTLAFAKVVAILIVNQSTASGDKLVLGAQGSAAFNAIFNGSDTAVLRINPKGHFIISSPIDGYTVTNATEDVLRVAYAGASGSIAYDLVILGRSA